jgi:hypothetical protein
MTLNQKSPEKSGRFTTPKVFNALTGYNLFGAGVLGANYSTTSTGTVQYTASTHYVFDLTGSNTISLGLLSFASYGGGFSSLSFTVKDGAATLLSHGFSSLSAAEKYFTDDPLSLGTLSGNVDLTITYKLTAKTPEGAGISYVLADAPEAARSVARSAGTASARAVLDRPITDGAGLLAAFAHYNAELSAISDDAVAAASARSVKGRFETWRDVRRSTRLLSIAAATRRVGR